MDLIYFQKIQSLDFSIICLQKTQKNTGLLTLVSSNFDREIFCYFVFCILTFSEHVLCQISIFVCRRAKRVSNYYSTEFHEILISDSVENSAFPLNHAVTIFWFDLSRSTQTIPERQGPIVLPFNTLKNNVFTHNKLFDC